MNKQIITSLLDTDLYKLTMMQVFFHRYPGTIARHKFHCRNKDVDLTTIVQEVREQIDALCELSFTMTELDYLRHRLPFLKRDFIDFLSIFRFNSKQITVRAVDGVLEIETYGPIWQTILYEIYVLSIVNETYFNKVTETMTTRQRADMFEEGHRRLEEKIELVRNVDGFLFTDFGTRRRFSKEWQESVVRHCKSEIPDRLFGTSNLNLARELDITPIGTMAHEYLQAFQAFDNRLADSQSSALEAWAQEYRGALGIALTDVIGIDYFLKDFDLYFAKLFDGVRHDSGDPYSWGEKVIAHYEKLKIDPQTKLLSFSDGLTFPKAVDLYKHFEGRIKTSYGIGTNLTNDLGLTPLNIVMKIVECNGKPVAKISDSPGKGMCEDEDYVVYLKKVFDEKPSLFDNPRNDYM